MHDDVDAVYGKEYHQKAKLSERNQKPKYFRKEVSWRNEITLRLVPIQPMIKNGQMISNPKGDTFRGDSVQVQGKT